MQFDHDQVITRGSDAPVYSVDSEAAQSEGRAINRPTRAPINLGGHERWDIAWTDS